MNRESHCPLCQCNDLDVIANKVRFGIKADVCKCQNCSIVFLDQKSFEFPKGFYENEYHRTYITHIEPDALDPKTYYEKMKKATKKWADKFKKLLTGDEIVLDVGCSTGHFITNVQAKTKRIYGCELSIKEIEFCRNILKLDVSDTPLDKRFKDGTFDYITLIYVLEHMAEPKSFLMLMKKILKPTGKLVILVPNIQDALLNLYEIPEFKNFYYCIEHLFYYSPDTIGKLLAEVGLVGNIEIIQEYPITNHLNWGYKLTPADTLSSRKEVPDILLRKVAPIEDWEKLWVKINHLYKEFLQSHGYGDRIWCVVGKEN